MSYKKMTRHLRAPGLRTITNRTTCTRGGRDSGTEQKYRKRITTHSKIGENNEAERMSYGEERLERSRMRKVTVAIKNAVDVLDGKTGVGGE